MGGGYSTAYGINDLGQIVLYSSTTPSGDYRAFVGNPVDGWANLGTLTGSSGTRGLAINENGEIAGVGYGPGGSWGGAVIGDASNGLTGLGTLGGGTSVATGINDIGQVVGRSQTSSGASHSFIGDATNGLIDLGTLGGTNSSANGVNNGGHVVGGSEVSIGDSVTHAYIGDVANGLVDLGTLGGANSFASDVNDAGMVTGWAQTEDGSQHAFVGDGIHGLTDLGTLYGGGAEGLAINDSEQVVGSVSGIGPYGYRAFFWDSVNGMLDLKTLVKNGAAWGSLMFAYDINNATSIAGWGFLVGGQQRAFLLEYAGDDEVTWVPLPSLSTLFAIGFGVLTVSRRRFLK